MLDEKYRINYINYINCADWSFKVETVENVVEICGLKIAEAYLYYTPVIRHAIMFGHKFKKKPL